MTVHSVPVARIRILKDALSCYFLMASEMREKECAVTVKTVNSVEVMEVQIYWEVITFNRLQLY
jgi:hypothetical protein